MNRTQLELDALPAVLAQLLERHLHVSNVEVGDVQAPSGGHSAAMLYFTAGWRDHRVSEQRDLVIRLEPAGNNLFLNQDILFEWSVMEGVGRHPNIPIPPLLLSEADPSVLGRPFYIMGMVPGDVPQDGPAYHAAGFMVDELTESERATLWYNGLDVLANLHVLDYRDGLAFLNRPERGPTGLAQYLNWIDEWYDWIRGGRKYPIIDAGMDYLMSSQPNLRDCVLWGDSRIGNMIFSADTTVAAVIDWEMAALGPGEADLAWWLVMDYLQSDGLEVPRLSGLPTREDTLARYEKVRGEPVGDLHYFEVLAALRFAIILVRFADLYRGSPLLAEDTIFDTNNHSIRLLAELLGLPVPKLSADTLRLLRDGKPLEAEGGDTTHT